MDRSRSVMLITTKQLKMKPIISLLIFLNTVVYCCAHLSCMDENNNPVDWFIGYKLPESYQYMYVLPDSLEWKLSENAINAGGMMKNTFDTMFKLHGDQDSFYGMYNDAVSESNMTNFLSPWWAHMKGAFAFQQNNKGFWIIHSIPHLSQHDDFYEYPQSGHVYAQHFLCVTLKHDDISAIVQQLAVARPRIQSYYVSPSIASTMPLLMKVLENKLASQQKNSTAPFVSAAGSLHMLHFAKSTKFNEDLYSDFIAPKLRASLMVETWRHGKNLPPACEEQYKIENVRSVVFLEFGIGFTTMSDHAKWAVTKTASKFGSDENKWICLGDINRQPSQFRRGGGSMCIQNADLWHAFSSLVGKLDDCTKL